MDYPGGPPTAHGCVFYAVNYGGNFFLVTNRNFRYFFIDFVSIFWYQFDICVGATPVRDEYGCSPGRLREGTSLAAFDLGAGRSPAIRLPQTRKNVGSFFPNSPLALQEKHSRLCCIFVSAFL